MRVAAPSFLLLIFVIQGNIERIWSVHAGNVNAHSKNEATRLLGTEPDREGRQLTRSQFEKGHFGVKYPIKKTAVQKFEKSETDGNPGGRRLLGDFDMMDPVTVEQEEAWEEEMLETEAEHLARLIGNSHGLDKNFVLKLIRLQHCPKMELNSIEN